MRSGLIAALAVLLTIVSNDASACSEAKWKVYLQHEYCCNFPAYEEANAFVHAIKADDFNIELAASCGAANSPN